MKSKGAYDRKHLSREREAACMNIYGIANNALMSERCVCVYLYMCDCTHFYFQSVNAFHPQKEGNLTIVSPR